LQPTVAVVILNFNGKKYLEQFLPSVLMPVYLNVQVIVADNGSSDGSIEFLRENFPKVIILDLEKNSGFAGGYNKALAKVDADIFVLLNSDVEVTPGWIEPVVELFETNEKIAAIQPKIRSYHNKEYFEYAGAAGGWIDSLGYPFARGRVFDTLEKDNGQYDDVQNVFWATGAALFIRSSVWRSAGGFDETFFAHQEEIDLCWRIQLMGYKIVVCPQSTVYHVGGGTLPKGEQKQYLNFRNNLMMLSKNLSGLEKVLIIPARIILDWAFAFKQMFSGESSSARAIFRAHWFFIRHIVKPSTSTAITKKPLRDLEGVYNGSLVFKYFISGRKFFSQIVKNSGL
jgi:GT2 family glycosyltransferase